MAVTFEVDDDTPDRELAAIACLIAVLRSDQPIPAPPRVIFDYSDGQEEPVPVAPPAPVTPPLPGPDAAVPPPADPAPLPADPAPLPADPAPLPASESLIQQEAARAMASGPGELDSNGIPWDERIHAGTKVQNADKSWRLKRGVDPALVTTVTAELKAAVAAAAASDPPAGAAPPPPTEPDTAAAADAATAFGAGGAGGASEVPPPPAGDAPPPPASAAPPPPVGDAAPAAPAAGELTYPQILTRANEAGLDYDTLNALAVEMGLEKFASLAKRNDLFRFFADAMEAKILELAAAQGA